MHSRRLYVISLIVLSVLLYLPSLFFPFHWDDDAQIVNNNLIRSVSNIPKLLTSSTFDVGGGIIAGAFYRPLVSLSYLINYQLWGLQAWGFRLFQILIHCLNVFLVFILMRKLLSYTNDSFWISFATAGIFAVHPIHVESIVYIGSVGEIMYTCLSLSALLILIHPKQISYRHILFFSLLIYLALLAKESAVTIMAIGVLYLLLFRTLNIRARLAYIALNSISLIVYLIIRLQYTFVPFIRNYGSVISDATLTERLLTMPYIIINYIQSICIPTLFSIYDNTVIRSVFEPRFLLNLASLIAIIMLGIYLIKRSTKHKNILYLCIGWFSIGLLPVLQILPIDMTTADRWMYLPSIGLIAFCVIIIHEFLPTNTKIRSYFFILLICILGIFASRTLAREYNWRSPLALFQHDYYYRPDSFELSTAYGVELLKINDYTHAFGMLLSAAYQNPLWYLARVNLASTYEYLGMFDRAEDENIALLNDPQTRIPFVFANLAVVYLHQNQFDNANTILDEGIRIFPSYNRLYFLKVLTYQKQGDIETAKEYLSSLLKKPYISQDIQEISTYLDAK